MILNEFLGLGFPATVIYIPVLFFQAFHICFLGANLFRVFRTDNFLRKITRIPFYISMIFIKATMTLQGLIIVLIYDEAIEWSWNFALCIFWFFVFLGFGIFIALLVGAVSSFCTWFAANKRTSFSEGTPARPTSS